MLSVTNKITNTITTKIKTNVLNVARSILRDTWNLVKQLGKSVIRVAKENHLANMCRNRNSNRQKYFNNKHESHNLQEESSENSSSSEVEDDEVLLTMESRTLPTNKIQSNSKLRHAFVMIENVKTKMMIDTGCSIDIIDKSTFMKINQNIELKQTKKQLFPYASQPIKTLGYFNGSLESKKRITTSKIFVIENNNTGNLLELLRRKSLIL